MTEFVRRIVSGNKSRFKDDDLKLELDLVYVTDRVIIMGYPASGIESLYRNRRQDAKKFLESRHSKNFWVFNFCPLKENSYDSRLFDGRVSRYPFPDHHPPPLAILPLVAREMHVWISGSPDRVAVLHCKAGKGRSGTMACAYLLSLQERTNPRTQNCFPVNQWAEKHTQRIIDVLPDSDEDPIVTKTKSLLPSVFEPSSSCDGILDTVPVEESSSRRNSEILLTDTLKDVLNMHTTRRMKAPREGKKPKQGVSIPSQRRWLNYWALILDRAAPSYFWPKLPTSLPPAVSGTRSFTSSSLKSKLTPKQNVRLTQIRLRMRQPLGVHHSLVRAANVVLERTMKNPRVVRSNTHSANQVWASLARYDDELVERLEKWESYTRDKPETMSGRHTALKAGKGTSDGRNCQDETISFEEEEMECLFEASGRWDKDKMVRSFARLGTADNEVVEEKEKGEKILTYNLRPLIDKPCKHIRSDLYAAKRLERDKEAVAMEIPYDVTTKQNEENGGVVLDASREVRVKFYMGQVFMGWIWFVPAFHMSQPPPASLSLKSETKSTLIFTRKEIDFPLGLGQGLIDIAIDLEWATLADIERSYRRVAGH